MWITAVVEYSYLLLVSDAWEGKIILVIEFWYSMPVDKEVFQVTLMKLVRKMSAVCTAVIKVNAGSFEESKL